MSAFLSTPTLVVLAAGAARRFGSVKQLTPVGPHGEALLDYTIYDAIRSGCGDVVVVTSPDLVDRMAAHLRDSFGRRVEPVVVPQPTPPGFERERPWGTAPALLAAAGRVAGNAVVVNADDYYGREAIVRLARHAAAASSFAVMAFALGDTLSNAGGVSRAVLEVDGDDMLTGITEVVDLVADGRAAVGALPQGGTRTFPLETPVSMNAWALTPAVFPAIEAAWKSFAATHGTDAHAELRLPDVIGTAVAAGERCRVFRTSESWFGLTHAGDREVAAARVAELIDRREYPDRLEEEID